MRSRGKRELRLQRTDGTVLPLRIRPCDTFWRRLRGLMFRLRVAPDEGLLFIESAETRTGTSIHMLFVFCSIAVVWLGTDGTVVDKRLAKPFRPLYVPKAPARYFLEGPPALLDWVQVGEVLVIEELGG